MDNKQELKNWRTVILAIAVIIGMFICAITTVEVVEMKSAIGAGMEKTTVPGYAHPVWRHP